MIFGKIWTAIRAQLNKLANFFWKADPIAQMQYEYDSAVVQLREGRTGLEQYRALVERVTRQANQNKSQVASLEGKIKAYLTAGNRDTAAKFAIELQKAKKELEENESQLKMHEEAYNNNVLKIKHATHSLAQVREKINKYDADLKMSRAEAELAQLAKNFDFNVTTDFGQAEQTIQDQIGLNRAKARVAADLSSTGIEDSQAGARDGSGHGGGGPEGVRARSGFSDPRDGVGRAPGPSARRRRRSNFAFRLAGSRRRPRTGRTTDSATSAVASGSPLNNGSHAHDEQRLASPLGPRAGRARSLGLRVLVRPARQRLRPVPLR